MNLAAATMTRGIDAAVNNQISCVMFVLKKLFWRPTCKQTRFTTKAITGWEMIRLLIFLLAAGCWLWGYTQPLQRFSSHQVTSPPCQAAIPQRMTILHFKPKRRRDRLSRRRWPRARPTSTSSRPDKKRRNSTKRQFQSQFRLSDGRTDGLTLRAEIRAFT